MLAAVLRLARLAIVTSLAFIFVPNVVIWRGAAARLGLGALTYLRDGESVEAMSRIGRN
jgi:hypothetical protein